jgi:hypothetical protein
MARIRGVRRDLAAVVPPWVLARLIVFLAFVVAAVGADELRLGARPVQLDQGLFAWDAAFYRDIADVGYGGVALEGLRFFPLLPLLTTALAVPLLGNHGLALVVIVNAAALAAGVLLRRLALHETGDEGVADRSAWLLALLPPAAVLVLGYAEALLLVLSIGAFLCYRQGRWWTAAALGLLAALSRPVGLALVLPALVEALRAWRGAPWRSLAARASAVVAPAVGCGIFLLWAEVERDDWKLPIRLQNSAHLRGGWQNPLETIGSALDAVTGDGRLGEGLHLPWLVVFGVLLVVVFRRLPVSYGLYSAALLAVALSGETLGSFERYGLSAFPLVLALAWLAPPPLLERLALAGAAAGLAGVAPLLFLGAFVP